VTVTTGAATFRLSVGAAFPFAEVVVDGRPRLTPEASGLVVTDAAGTARPCVLTSLTVEEAGPLRAVVRAEGHATGAEPLEVTLRAEFFAGLPTTRLSVTLRNRRRASHPGGIWVLGDPGSFLFGECVLSFTMREADDAATAAAVATGVLLIALEVVTLSAYRSWEEWLNVILGVWLIAAPWILGVGSTAATANFVIVGVLVVALAAYELRQSGRTP
jgi:hypothetical protein